MKQDDKQLALGLSFLFALATIVIAFLSFFHFR